MIFVKSESRGAPKSAFHFIKTTKKTTITTIALFISITTILASCSSEIEKKYTFTAQLPWCSSWNPAQWNLPCQHLILNSISTPFFEFIEEEGQTGYKVLPELALREPEDVTATYAGLSSYGIPQDATEGYAWKINICQNAAWEDGTPITSDTVEYTLQQFLDPRQSNFWAFEFTSDGLPLANATTYYEEKAEFIPCVNNQTAIQAQDIDLWTSLYQGVYFLAGFSIQEFGQDWWTEDPEGSLLWSKLTQAFGTSKYVRLTTERKNLLMELARLWGDQNPMAYREFCFIKKEISSIPWEQVGFVKDDDYSFTLILNKETSKFMVEYELSNLYLLKPDLYQQCLTQEGEKLVSSYGTSKETIQSYGPYTISDYLQRNYMYLERNKNWFGWTDEKHQDQYMTTDIKFLYGRTSKDAMSLFLQGKLDKIFFDDQMAYQFQDSPYLLFTDTATTFRYSINTDRAFLDSENVLGTYHSILANINFRKGLSLALDREEFIRQTSPMSSTAYGLFGNHPATVPSEPQNKEINGSTSQNNQSSSIKSYRETEEARNTILQIYGSKNPRGNNLELARKAMETAYQEELSRGLHPSDIIVINYYAPEDTDAVARKVEFLKQTMNQATTGTSLEGKIFIIKRVSQDFYEDIKNGKADIAITGWTEKEYNPYSMLKYYNTQQNLQENGFKPEEEKLTINLDGQEITKTYFQWYNELCYGQYASAEEKTKNTILAQIEKAHLQSYRVIPLEYRIEPYMNSMRLLENTRAASDPLGRTSMFRWLRFTMDDRQWEQWCKKKSTVTGLPF